MVFFRVYLGLIASNPDFGFYGVEFLVGCEADFEFYRIRTLSLVFRDSAVLHEICTAVVEGHFLDPRLDQF